MEQKLKTLLVIEDDLAMRSIVVRKLKLSGFDVIEAENGTEGLKKWLAEKPDLVILDLMLPEMDGFEVLEEIRKNPDPGIASTKVVVLSNLWNNENINKAKQLNIQAYFVKAYLTTEEIAQKIKDIFAGENKT